jgi:diguanylate cyclase (GGDEF)-like protein/PAS domain S-box-containing protein
MLQVVACIALDHGPLLVALAVVICALACLTYVNMVTSAAARRGASQRTWVAAASMLFGCGVWAMHFVAMIGFCSSMTAVYALLPTAVSLGLVVLGSAAAALAWVHGGAACGRSVTRRVPGHVPKHVLPRVLAGGLIGASVAAVHFTGMEALRQAGTSVLDADLVAASVVLGTLLLVAAMGRELPRQRATAACLLVLGVCVLHFAAMAAVHLYSWTSAEPREELVASGSLAVAVGGIALLILLLSLAGTAMDAHMARMAANEASRLRQFAEATFEGILFCRQGRVIDVNSALGRLGGWDVKAVIGRRLEQLFVPQARDLLRPVGVGIGVGARTVAIETALLTSDGSTRPVELLSRSILQDGAPTTVVAVRDISERKAAQQRIGELAHYDTLTGCANRALFRDRLDEALAMAGQFGHGVALLYGNIDRFREVNDLLGHAGGDRVLIEVANRLRARLRDTDTLARLGGDEFAIIQPRIATPADAPGLAERLLGSLADRFEIDGQRIQINMTIGIALSPQNAATGETLLCAADVVLRRGKQDARGWFHCYTHEMDRELVQRLALGRDLARALPRGELTLRYQPVFQVATQRLVGHEALLRWQHPERGAISPAVFVPLAEQSRLIVPIGQWVLRTACTAAAAMPGAFRIAVNLSPVQVRTPDLPGVVAEILHDTGLVPERLELEITEGVLIEESDHMLAMLRALKCQGVRLVLDDFGTGYSSLSYLRRFPFDRLKIDQSFMKGLGEDGDSDAIVRAILALGHSLRLEVTAEGVETEQQLRVLHHYGCDEVQGFLLGRPEPNFFVDRMQVKREVEAA